MADEDEDSTEKREAAIEQLKGFIALLATSATCPSAKLTTEHLRNLTTILAMIDVELSGGKGELAEDLWDAFKWEPAIEEKRRGLMWFIDFALEHHPEDRAAAGEKLSTYLSNCWPSLGLSPSDLEVIRTTVAESRSNTKTAGIAAKLCRGVPRLDAIFVGKGKGRTSAESAFREARRGGARVRTIGGKNGIRST